jgi:phage gp36-like protein
MAHASPADMRRRYDERSLAELVNDSNSAVDLGDLATDPNLLVALDDASGDVDAALLAGGRYTTAQLAALTGSSLSLLKRITCHLAWSFLEERRNGAAPQHFEERTSWVDKKLELMRKGHNIFNLEVVIDAGQAELKHLTITAVHRANLVRDRTHRYYPQRTYAQN